MKKALGIIAASLIVVTGLMQSPDARAQGVMSIAALVNDEAISVFDLQTRIELTILSSGLPRNREIRQRLASQVLRELIKERLQLQEAKRLGIKVKDSSVNNALKDIAKNNPAAQGDILGFLKAQGIDGQTMFDQTKAQIAWYSIINREARRKIKISKEEIDTELAHVEANKKKPQRLISEIFFAVDDSANEREIRSLADRLTQQLKSGVDFSRLASQFSQSPTAAAGGDLGWLSNGQLDPKIETALSRMKAGEISAPIRTLTGYYIVHLRGQRSAGSEEADRVKLKLHQVMLDVPKQATREIRDSIMAKGRSIAGKATSCSDMDAIGKKVGSPLSGSLGTVAAGKLPPALRGMVEKLPINQASTPVMTPNGVMVLMVCSREAGTKVSDAAKRARIKRKLEGGRRELIARQLMRDLQRSAIIDIRL